MTTADTLTVLTSTSGKHAGKRFSLQKDGKIKNRSYGNEKYFAVDTIEVDGIESLARALEKLSQNQFSFVIRGAPLPGINRQRTHRRVHPDRKTGEPATFQDQARHWFSIDVDRIPCPPLTDPRDDPEGAVEYVIGLLPPELHDATTWWQFSSSQSVPVSPGADETLSLHLWYWSLEPLDSAALTRWAIAANTVSGIKLVGPELFRTVQAHYVCSPRFVEPLKDPLIRRSGLRRGLDDAVSLVIPPPHPKRLDEPSATGYEPGIGVEAHLAQIGGPRGFRPPIVSAIASYVAIYGSAADVQPLYRAIRAALDRAEPGWRSDPAGAEHYADDDHLDAIAEGIRKIHGDQPPKGFIGEPPENVVDPDIPPPLIADELLETRLIRVLAGCRHEAADQGLAAMHHAGIAFYQRDRSLVRVSLIKAKTASGDLILLPGVISVTKAILGRALGQSARWERLSDKGKPIRIDPPREVVEQVLDMIGDWPFPPLAGVIACPTLRPDGSLLSTPGYDLSTGLVLHNGVAIPQIPEYPTRGDAERALLLVTDLLEEFPFANDDDLSKAVALSQTMTPVLRGAFPVAPMHLTNAPQPGTGKSYLADIASMIATGERAAVISVAPNPEETEKRLVGAALAGHPIISLDNCRDLLQGDFLCQVTERPLLQLRRLGSSDQIRVANTFCVFANGNNVTIADDLVRRDITCTLDANMENPEKRTFVANPLAMVRRNRGLYVAACLTIARAYIAAGKPDRLPPLPSYEGWSDVVRSPLVWLGYPDPVNTMDAARGDDPIRQNRASVFAAWRKELTVDEGYLASDIVELACRYHDYGGAPVRPELRIALLAVAAQKASNGTQIDARRLGIWLKKNENTVADGHKLTADRNDLHRPKWRLGPPGK